MNQTTFVGCSILFGWAAVAFTLLYYYHLITSHVHFTVAPIREEGE